MTASVCPQCGGPGEDARANVLCSRCRAAAANAATLEHKPVPKPAIAPKSGETIEIEALRAAVRRLDLATDADLDRLSIEAAHDPSKLADALVRATLITRYQATALLRGKSRGLALGDYLILDRLGIGGMGVVFKARDRRSDRVVALKLLPPSFARAKESVERFQREFLITSRLSHPNLVAAIESRSERGIHYLTMEYIDGHDLESLVASGGALAVDLALHCAIQVGRGLEAAHSQGIVHRDVKPGNVMIDAKGNIRVLDLGLARVLETTSQLAQEAGASLTQTGAYMGTADYLAPEQADDAKRADHRADIYGLGCTLYFLLTGKVPFPAETLLKRLIAHQEMPAPSLCAARPEVPAAIDAFYQRMLEKKPGDRPQSMHEVINVLESLRAAPGDSADSTADLRAIARTFMKRAPHRGGKPSPSVFARTQPQTNLGFNPLLALDDVVLNYRDEVAQEPLSPDKLPPPPPRVRPARKRRNTAVLWSLLPTAALFVIGASVVSNMLKPKPEADGSAIGSPQSVAPSPKEPAPAPNVFPAPGYRALFNGTDLSGWQGLYGAIDACKVVDGSLVLTPRPGSDVSEFFMTKAAFNDFHMKLEFQVADDTNSAFCAADTYPNKKPGRIIEVVDIGPKRSGDVWIMGDGQGLRSIKVKHVPFKRGDAWETLEVDRSDGLVTLHVNGEKVHDKAELITGLQHLGFQLHTGTIRVRNIQIKENGSTDSTAPKSEPSPPKLLGKVVYVDEFTDPASGWRVDETRVKGNNRPIRRKYENGTYILEMPELWSGFEAWDCTGPIEHDIQVEGVGRVLGVGDFNGAWGFMIPGPEGRGVEVCITRDAHVVVKPCQWATDKFPNDPFYLEPTPHHAIKAGHEWNTLTVRVRKRSVEVLVNGIAIGKPIVLDWDYRPAKPEIAVFKPFNEGRIRAEFERVEVRELLSGK